MQSFTNSERCFSLYLSHFRQKEHLRLGNGTIRPTLPAEDAEGDATTFKKNAVAGVGTLMPNRDTVSLMFSLFIPIYSPPCFVAVDNWGEKAIRRRTTGTGRMRHLKIVARRFRNGFREGTKAKSRKATTAKTETS